jgi:hypothetical protein
LASVASKLLIAQAASNADMAGPAAMAADMARPAAAWSGSKGAEFSGARVEMIGSGTREVGGCGGSAATAVIGTATVATGFGDGAGCDGAATATAVAGGAKGAAVAARGGALPADGAAAPAGETDADWLGAGKLGSDWPAWGGTGVLRPAEFSIERMAS